MNQKLLEEMLETGLVEIQQIVPFKMISLFDPSEGESNKFFEWWNPKCIDGDNQFKEQIEIMWNGAIEIPDEDEGLKKSDALLINEIRKMIEKKGLDTDFFMVFYDIAKGWDSSVYMKKCVVYKTLDECFEHILKDFKKLKEERNG